MDAAGEWHALLRPEEELSPAFCRRFADAMRARKLTFGERLHSPFLRPFFLTDRDEARIRTASEAIAAAGERVVRAALESPSMMRQLGMTEPEIRLVEIDPGYGTASTASRLDAFLLPDSLHFAEYNAESPAGLGYTQRLCELFDTLPAMTRFRGPHRVRHYGTIDAMLGALLASYAEWGGRASPPVIAIVDWRDVPTWSEFEILADAFAAAGVPTVISDPRDLSFDGGVLRAGDRAIDLVYRRVLINDIVSRSEECRALVDAYRTRAVCVANTFRCKLAHKKAFFAVLTDPAHAPLFTPTELDIIHASVPWTRVVEDIRTQKEGRESGLLEIARQNRERLVLKPNDEYGGKGVVLGWETNAGEWEGLLDAALADPVGTWIVQERIPVRREVFPQFDAEGRVTMRDMLVDFAPYLFRGRMGGFLTRLSGTGLANVTSGGGQVPAFVVEEGSA
ncbi:MAG TPA: circularly permuted type 2 ATP-grasp protein [Vicinamibacterales bacterium]|jgi:uncharacterized circularly permuted ATP-grasp superfamily protein|nr:circularly permuted type 2 ATP-grasp protein [Vicinamibacterales bacterium]